MLMSLLLADPITPVVAHGRTLILTPVVVTIVTGLLMPFLVALVTKVNASPATKGVIGVVLAFVAALVERAMLADGTAVFTAGLLLDVGAVYVPQLVSYFGVWKHVDINSKVAPTVGIGPSTPTVP